ncbi:MAG TPA: hypothetical protein VE974_01590 [Thermoanaerobaculia bacterium]|nr:hypothetical protein [Thermoanaerobaculia bacterium]
MERRSRLDEARKRLVRLVRLHRPDEPEIEVRPAAADSKHAERARELMERPDLARFREKK